MPTHMPRPPIQLLIVIIDLAGGTGTFCRILASGLRKFFPGEFEISLLILRGNAPAEENQSFDHIHTINSDVHRDWRRWIESPAHIFHLSKSINRINPDLILTVNTYSNLLVPLAGPPPPRHSQCSLQHNPAAHRISFRPSHFAHDALDLTRVTQSSPRLKASPTIWKRISTSAERKSSLHGVDLQSIQSQANKMHRHP